VKARLYARVTRERHALAGKAGHRQLRQKTFVLMQPVRADSLQAMRAAGHRLLGETPVRLDFSAIRGRGPLK
jgi:hypothetical protein